MKNLSKSTVWLFLAIFLLGGAATVAKVSGYPQASDYAMGKASELYAEIQRARVSQTISSTEVSATTAQ